MTGSENGEEKYMYEEFVFLCYPQISTSVHRRHVKTVEAVRICKMPFVVLVQAVCPVRLASKVGHAGI